MPSDRTSPRTTRTSRSSWWTTARRTGRPRSWRAWPPRIRGCGSCPASSRLPAGSASPMRSTRAPNGPAASSCSSRMPTCVYDRVALREGVEMLRQQRLDLLAFFPAPRDGGILGKRADAVHPHLLLLRSRIPDQLRPPAALRGRRRSRDAGAPGSVPRGGRARGSACVGHRRHPPRGPRAPVGRALPHDPRRRPRAASDVPRLSPGLRRFHEEHGVTFGGWSAAPLALSTVFVSRRVDPSRRRARRGRPRRGGASKRHAAGGGRVRADGSRAGRCWRSGFAIRSGPASRSP